MKVELKESTGIQLNSLSVGETGKIILCGSISDQIVGHIILRTYDEFVDLTEPSRTWNSPMDGSPIRVERKEFKLVEI